MNAEELRSLQTPIKERYRKEPAAAVVTLHAEGRVGEGIACRVVATALGIGLRDARVHAEGDLDFRGTLGVAKDAPVGFREIRLRFALDSDAPEEQLKEAGRAHRALLRGPADAAQGAAGQGRS